MLFIPSCMDFLPSGEKLFFYFVRENHFLSVKNRRLSAAVMRQCEIAPTCCHTKDSVAGMLCVQV